MPFWCFWVFNCFLRILSSFLFSLSLKIALNGTLGHDHFLLLIVRLDLSSECFTSLETSLMSLWSDQKPVSFLSGISWLSPVTFFLCCYCVHVLFNWGNIPGSFSLMWGSFLNRLFSLQCLLKPHWSQIFQALFRIPSQ